ncbi:hypothetical protein [Rheinheimera baltica]|uniref:hypothetical protein n=1 Tax=Rheinheimera baltica TaxID=67576 RepID=UPI00273D752D|nr:hypothetical protein [Rheinheimera baltica]MDP5151352.1 hypothetical protein [Rheinheimera baltica]MDP5188906.1 hypothetical protein [Rheinheimera baltica]
MDKVALKKYVGLISNIFLAFIVFVYLILIFKAREQFSFALLAVLLGLGLIAIAMLAKSTISKKHNVKNT